MLNPRHIFQPRFANKQNQCDLNNFYDDKWETVGQRDKQKVLWLQICQEAWSRKLWETAIVMTFKERHLQKKYKVTPFLQLLHGSKLTNTSAVGILLLTPQPMPTPVFHHPQCGFTQSGGRTAQFCSMWMESYSSTVIGRPITAVSQTHHIVNPVLQTALKTTHCATYRLSAPWSGDLRGKRPAWARAAGLARWAIKAEESYWCTSFVDNWKKTQSS